MHLQLCFTHGDFIFFRENFDFEQIIVILFSDINYFLFEKYKIIK